MWRNHVSHECCYCVSARVHVVMYYISALCMVTMYLLYYTASVFKMLCIFIALYHCITNFVCFCVVFFGGGGGGGGGVDYRIIF